MKIAHRLIEIRDAKRATDYRHDRKIGRGTCFSNQPALLGLDFKRIGKNIYRVEANLLGKLDSTRGIDRRAQPR